MLVLLPILWIPLSCHASEHSNDRPNSPPQPTVTIATLRRVWRSGESDSISSLLADLANLQHLQGHIMILTPTNSKGSDSSYTKSWTNDEWGYYQARSLRRYGRHLVSWTQSPTARAVLPTVGALMVWSALVYHAFHHYFPTLLPWVKDGDFVIGLGSFTAPISLLLALRTNRALNRLLEGRSMWGALVRASTTLAGLAATYIQPQDSNVALLMGRYLAILGWCLKGSLRNEEDTEVLRTVLPPDEAAWMERSPGDHPTAIICRLRQLIASQVKHLPLVAAQAMEDRLAELEVVVGTCKRLLGSPIPPTYTRHTSRVLCLYLGMVPLALVGNSKAGLSAILVNVALLSYVFVGIDEIGVEIEHPFPLLPMYHLSKVTQDNVGNQFIMSCP